MIESLFHTELTERERSEGSTGLASGHSDGDGNPARSVSSVWKVCELCGRVYFNRAAHFEECSGPKP